MRYLCLSLIALVVFSGATCLDWPLFDWLNPQDQDNDATTACHSGTFQCADGPELTDCGTWSFDVNEADAVVGSGEITSGFSSVPVQLTLSGIVDTDSFVLQITITSEAGGSGEMSLGYDGPTLALSGDWSFTDAPEPSGIEVSGEVTGESCESLW